jgi:transcriptional regulator with XRE-family HTH domain
MDTIDILQNLLKEKNKTRNALSVETGISSGLLSDWFSRKKKPASENLLKLAEYFNVTVDYLLTGKEQEYNSDLKLNNETLEYLEELQTRPEMKIFFTLLRDVDKEELEKFVAVIEAMKGKK